MKKIGICFSIFMILFLGIYQVFAAEKEQYELQFTMVNNSKNEEADLYILLPKEYIIFAIKDAGLKIEYDGSATLKQNEIPGINVKKENIQEDVYIEKNVEYVQILLEKSDEGNYLFNILNSYKEMNIKYRIKSENKDYIMHIDNFEVIKNVCEIEYDYDNNSIKQPNKKLITFGTICLIVILILVIVFGITTYIKQRR